MLELLCKLGDLQICERIGVVLKITFSQFLQPAVV